MSRKVFICVDCGRIVHGLLARLGSIRCHDCRLPSETIRPGF